MDEENEIDFKNLENDISSKLKIIKEFLHYFIHILYINLNKKFLILNILAINTFPENNISVLSDNNSDMQKNIEDFKPNHKSAVWKQEFNQSINDILINLDEINTITNNVKRLNGTMPEDVDTNTKRDSKNLENLLNNLNDEKVKQLRDLVENVMENNKKNNKRKKKIPKENLYPLSPSKKQKRHESHSIF